MKKIINIQNMFKDEDGDKKDFMYILFTRNNVEGIYYTMQLASNAGHSICYDYAIYPIKMESKNWKKQLKTYKTISLEEIIELRNNTLKLSYNNTIGDLEILCLLIMQYPDLLSRYPSFYNACKNIKFPAVRYSGVVHNFRKFLDAIPSRYD
jgi:hypothetical protein